MNLCENCLERTAERSTPVGPEKGSQREPYHDTLLLCEPCRTALLNGDLGAFSERFQEKRTVARGE